MALISVFWAIDLSLTPYLLKLLLNGIIDLPLTQEAFYASNGLPVALYFLMIFLQTTASKLYDYFISFQMIPKMRQKITLLGFDLLLAQSHYYYQHTFTGSLANKLNDLTSNIPDILQLVLDKFFGRTLALFVALYTLWQVNYHFALGMFDWIVSFGLCSWYFSKKLILFSSKWSESGTRVTEKIVDVLSNMLSVRLFARHKYEKDVLNHALEYAVDAERGLQKSYFWLWFVYGYSFCILSAFNLYFLVQGRVQGLISVGDFALVLTLNISILNFLGELTREFSDFMTYLGKTRQSLKSILMPVDIKDKINAPPLKVKRGEIAFESVFFHYKGATPLFNKPSIIIKGGQKAGLVGYSGSGKTTFINILLRLFDINEGRILIDGQDIQDVTQASLRESIGMIPQDPSLFHRSLMENIRYGCQTATDEEVLKASHQSYCHEFIAPLAEGYASLVGERGVKLSGGQRQRIAIARAFLKSAPILILDEATSQLDSITEGKIQLSLWELMKNKTTLVVAHRLSTLLHMDRILGFDKGKIVEDDSHDELLKKNGLYKTLWETQAGGFLPKDR